jgi:hypothetical protein
MAADKDKKAPDVAATDEEVTLDPETDADVFVDQLTATFSAIASAEADDIHASGSAIGSATAGSLTATASAIGLANIEGDAHISVSAVPILRTTGGATFSQAYASAVIVGGDMEIHQAAAPVIIGKSMDATQLGAAVVVTGDADIKRSTIGFLLSRNATVSDDSRVLLGTKAAIIIAAALLGGFGFVAIAMVMSARRISEWRPSINLPKLTELKEELKGLDLHSLPWKRSA